MFQAYFSLPETVTALYMTCGTSTIAFGFIFHLLLLHNNNNNYVAPFAKHSGSSLNTAFLQNVHICCIGENMLPTLPLPDILTRHKTVSIPIDVADHFVVVETTCQVDMPSDRVDCGHPGITKNSCIHKGCCWDESVYGVPWCFQRVPQSPWEWELTSNVWMICAVRNGCCRYCRLSVCLHVSLCVSMCLSVT